MKEKILYKITIVIMMASILLSGCGKGSENQEDDNQSSEVVQEIEEHVEREQLFSGTIFDNLVMGETTKVDVEKLLEDRILEYEYVHVDNAIYSVSGKTTITDEFGEWNALYKYILVGSGAKEDYKLTDWTVELLLTEDAEYKEAVKYIQNIIDAKALEGYTAVEDTYSDDMVQGDVIYYPIEKFKMNDIDGIKYIMLGKYANCDTEEAKHIIVLSVGIIEEEDFLKGEIEKIPTIEIKITPIEDDPVGINPSIKDSIDTENMDKENEEVVAIEGIRISEGAKYQFQMIEPEDIIIEYSGSRPDESLAEFKGNYSMQTTKYDTDVVGVYLEEEYFEIRVEDFVWFAEAEFEWDVSKEDLYILWRKELEVPTGLFKGEITYTDGRVENIDAEYVELKYDGYSIMIIISISEMDSFGYQVEISEAWLDLNEDRMLSKSAEEYAEWYEGLGGEVMN